MGLCGFLFLLTAFRFLFPVPVVSPHSACNSQIVNPSYIYVDFLAEKRFRALTFSILSLKSCLVCKIAQGIVINTIVRKCSVT